MTERTRRNLEIAGMILGVGVAWGVLTASVQGKVDQADFRADSVEVRAELRAVLSRVGDLTSAVEENNARVRELYCAERPQASGCR